MIAIMFITPVGVLHILLFFCCCWFFLSFYMFSNDSGTQHKDNTSTQLNKGLYIQDLQVGNCCQLKDAEYFLRSKCEKNDILSSISFLV